MSLAKEMIIAKIEKIERKNKMTYSEKRSFLIQRGKFKENVKKITGMDSIIEWDYMGAAEYEFGALPASLKRIIEHYRNSNLEPRMVVILGLPFIIFISKNSENEIPGIIKVMADLAEHEYSGSRYSVKMGCHFNEYFKGPTITRIKKGCKKKTENVYNYNYCNFWWDIEADWFLMPSENEYAVIVDTALNALAKTKFGKKKTIGIWEKIFGGKKN